MRYLVRMDVHLPHDLDPVVRDETIRREREYSQQLQRDGEWAAIWRIPGQYSNYSLFEVDSHDRLHKILWNLPLFPHMDIEVTPLAKHPSDIH